MTQNELLALINAKIAGQGSAVDIGGALPAILSALAAAATPIEVDDITALTGAQLDALEIGAKVAKKTGTAKHLYVVSYKVSYDHTESGWAYNSTDKGSIPPAA